MAFAKFIFRMTDALVSQLEAQFSAMPWSSLNQTEIDAEIKAEDRNARGVYLLGRGAEEDVSASYVGQSSSALYERLSRHAKFLQDRCGLRYEKLRFKAAGIVIFDSVELEGRLISHYGTGWNKDNPSSGWNNSDTRSNDTGSGRDKQKPSGFDRRFPIDITLIKPDLLVPGNSTAKQLFNRLKIQAPYTIRPVPTQLGNHTELQSSTVAIDRSDASVLYGVQLLLTSLPAGWSVRVDPVRVLLQRDVEAPAEALINPPNWPPERWLSGKSQTIIFRRV